MKIPFYDTLAQVLIKEGKFDEADDAIQKAIVADQENPLWLLTEAEIGVAAGHLEDARKALQSLGKLNNVDPKKWPEELRTRYETVVKDAKMKA